MKGKMGHRPGSLNKHDQEGVADKTKTLAGGRARSMNANGKTDKTVGRFGGLNLHDGEGHSNKANAASGKRMSY